MEDLTRPNLENLPPKSYEADSWPKSVIVPLESPFEDHRGSIQPLVDVDMKSCVLITSKAGSVRANHFHKSDWHYCYVISGEIIYYERQTGTENPPTVTTIISGQMFFTPPMRDHTMYFSEETVFLAFGRNSRAQESYESDVVRIPTLMP